MSFPLQHKTIYFEDHYIEKLNYFVDENRFSTVFILVDENTAKHCLNLIEKSLDFDFKTIEIPAGESYKTLETCAEIWQKMSDEGADRQSLLINLGGGVVTDIGGFVASCYRRGIAFIHMPTTLLGMVDAAIGGKNGVDFKHLKNQIGIIRSPEMILIEKDFLNTLPKNQIASGFAEVIKHGLINSHSTDYFFDCMKIETIDFKSIYHLIEESINIKNCIVNEDTDEKGLRKVLNYGHTLGHAIESYRMSFESSKHLLHGEAIAIGLILETYISYKSYGFPKSILDQLKACIAKFYEKQYFDEASQKKIVELMKFDKKNYKNQINFVLLRDIGKAVFDCQVKNELIKEAFDFYHEQD